MKQFKYKIFLAGLIAVPSTALAGARIPASASDLIGLESKDVAAFYPYAFSRGLNPENEINKRVTQNLDNICKKSKKDSQVAQDKIITEKLYANFTTGGKTYSTSSRTKYTKSLPPDFIPFEISQSEYDLGTWNAKSDKNNRIIYKKETVQEPTIVISHFECINPNEAVGFESSASSDKSLASPALNNNYNPILFSSPVLVASPISAQPVLLDSGFKFQPLPRMTFQSFGKSFDASFSQTFGQNSASHAGVSIKVASSPGLAGSTNSTQVVKPLKPVQAPVQAPAKAQAPEAASSTPETSQPTLAEMNALMKSMSAPSQVHPARDYYSNNVNNRLDSGRVDTVGSYSEADVAHSGILNNAGDSSSNAKSSLSTTSGSAR